MSSHRRRLEDTEPRWECPLWLSVLMLPFLPVLAVLVLTVFFVVLMLAAIRETAEQIVATLRR